ncbi:MAG: DUF192 domain-containing protein [Gemmatimonadetes bacterium]|nr:DUF192 domain-containing protein [Gemmatimonadota bacterium]
MTHVRVTNQTRASVLGTRVRLADSWLKRMRGFLARPAPAEGEGLLLTPCRAVHMYWMTYSLDVLFLDRHGRVVALYPWLKPRRRTAFHGSAEYALELPAGSIEASGTQVHDLIVWKPVTEAEAMPHARGAGGADSPAPLDLRARDTGVIT